MTFFKHKKFWLPILILMLIFALAEVVIRSGIYSPLLAPNSFLGSSYYRIKAIESFGEQNVDLITVGDSKVDWGLDHKKIKNTQFNKGINHLRFSFAGANFLTYQASIDWAIANYKNLNGVILGISETEFFAFNNLENEIKITWPFKKHINSELYNYLGENHHFNSIFQKTAVYNYFSDVKQLVKNPFQRLKQIKSNNFESELNYNVSNNKNMCEYDLSSLKACNNSARNAKKAIVSKQYQEVFDICTSSHATKNLLNNSNINKEKSISRFSKNWLTLFNNVLDKNKNLTLVLLPEHELYDYYKRPTNSEELINLFNTKFEKNPDFKIIDLRNAFNYEEKCSLFSDINHYNRKGSDKITQALLKKM